MTDNRDLAAKRIELLERFLADMELLRSNDSDLAQQRKVRSKVNRSVVAIRQAVREAGVGTGVVVTPHALVGGIVANVDVFTSLFQPVHGLSVASLAVEMAERAIGFYENVRDATGLVSPTSTDALDIVAAIDRALRPAFGNEPPTDEKAVQHEVATILRAAGVEFHREKERAPIGPTSFIPDFTVPALDLAIEVKLSKPGHRDAAIQRELAQDVAAYRTKWKHMVVVIYDTGAITDPDALKRENMTHFGIVILVVKH